jgi:hypothetical protein
MNEKQLHSSIKMSPTNMFYGVAPEHPVVMYCAVGSRNEVL